MEELHTIKLVEKMEIHKFLVNFVIPCASFLGSLLERQSYVPPLHSQPQQWAGQLGCQILAQLPQALGLPLD